jgi:rubrerythrin
VIEQEATRREAVRRGLLAGGAIASAAVVPAAFRSSRAFGQADTSTASGDTGIIEGAVGIEQTAVVVYRTIAARGLLGPATPVAELFAKQEQEHADALIAALKGLGGTPPAKPLPTDIPGFTEVQSGPEALAFAVSIENQELAHYIEGVKKLEDPNLMKAVAQIVGNEGQHLVVLRQALSTDPMPVSLPTGEEKT